MKNSNIFMQYVDCNTWFPYPYPKIMLTHPDNMFSRMNSVTRTSHIQMAYFPTCGMAYHFNKYRNYIGIIDEL